MVSTNKLMNSLKLKKLLFIFDTQLLVFILMMGFVYSSVPVSVTVTMTVSQHEEYVAQIVKLLNPAFISFIMYTCAFLTVTCQMDFDEKGLLFSVMLF